MSQEFSICEVRTCGRSHWFAGRATTSPLGNNDWAEFCGPNAEALAREYADWKNGEPWIYLNSKRPPEPNPLVVADWTQERQREYDRERLLQELH